MSRFYLVILFTALLVSGCSTNKSPLQNPDSIESCKSCHSRTVTAFSESVHGQGRATCSDCHDNLDQHLKLSKDIPTTDMSGDSCANCHTKEHSQWLASPHAKIPLDLFPQDMRIMQCMKCHTATGFAAVLSSGDDFKSAWGPPPEGKPEAVTCTACHNPHGSTHATLLRLPKAEICSSCHGGKWQNNTLNGKPADPYIPPGDHSFGEAPVASPAHPFGSIDYSSFSNHPHNSGDRCVSCHMAKTPGVEALGGHTFSMKTTADGQQNTAACAACHENTDSYDINGKQTEVKAELLKLENALKEHNNGVLPGNQPGTCNQCHKGGSLPFDHDPDFVLSNAYETYKQVDRDKSLGVHNAPFVLKVLQDAIEAVEKLYKP